jgi:AraC-like DNA-binding protein
MPINIQHAKSLIRTNLSTLRSVNDIARLCQCHPETLRKSFAREEGEPINRFILTLRVDRVKEELVHTEKLCKEILFGNGFNREDSGARLFTRMVGMTMLEYRTRMRTGTGPHPPPTHKTRR